jgi:hypothetical protein
MALRNSIPLSWKPKGVSDTVDGTNAFPGAMKALINLIPDPTTDNVWIPRPASTELTDFETLPGSTGPWGLVSGLLVVGDFVYGMVASARNAGKDEPFVYHISDGTLHTVNGITNANTPTSPAATGDWTPPQLVQVGSRIIVTHPGFPGTGGIFFGWFDVSAFTTTVSGSTNTSVTLTGFATDPTLAGVQPGMTISGTDIPAGATVVSTTVNTIVISAAATGSHGPNTFTIAGGTPTQPLWGAGNTDRNPLPSVPLDVAQFNLRAYYVLGVNGIIYSDAGFPCIVKNTSHVQALLTGDGLPVTCIGALQLSSLLGGIVQSLIAFQGTNKMQQITGDEATTNLAMNALPVSTGTLAPNSVCNTDNGLAFISPEGLRLIDLAANVSPPIGDHGTGVAAPFIYSLTPSRICAGSKVDTIRISVTNGLATGTPTEEWWYDLTRKVWSGPHTFPSSLIQPGGSAGFITVASGINGKLWNSGAYPSTSAVFVENGVEMTATYRTTLLPDNAMMSMNAITQTTISAQLFPGITTIIALDENDQVIDQTEITTAAGSNPLWDFAVWDQDNWDAVIPVFQQFLVPWTQPLVFKQFSLQVIVDSDFFLRIGTFYMNYERLGYTIASAA